MRPKLAFLFMIVLAGASTITRSADSNGTPRSMEPAEATAGTLLFEGTAGYHAAPYIATDVSIRVTGLIARTRVEQRFLNPSQDWVEGVYVFPLPEDAAVDSLEMRIGERILKGEIQERQRARQTYEKAKQEGRKTSLVEQERPNIFTTSVANIGPGEEISISIEYQEDARYDLGRFSLRFPMVVGPRYVPGPPEIGGIDETGWSTSSMVRADAERISPPVIKAPPQNHEQDLGDSHSVSIGVELDAGFRLASIKSPSHPVSVQSFPKSVYSVSLQEGRALADSDFVLEWSPIVGSVPSAALFQEQWGGQSYALIMLMPPKQDAGERLRLSRETIFVIDTSGSMGGESIVQARNALDLALTNLRPEDSFNIIRFSSNFESLYPESRLADPRAIAEARSWVARLQAGGGTEMLTALRAAFSPGAERSAVRQVIFMTDGAVGNEDALFQAVHDGIGKSRLYTIGIGSAPNSHFMTRAAEFGRGTFTYISSPTHVEEKMNELFAKLSSPVMHDIEVTWDQQGVEAWPARIPDVYLGEPIVLAARLPSPIGRVRVTGRRNTERIEMEVPVNGGSAESGIARLWARRKIKSLVDSIHGGADRTRVGEEVTVLGLRHHIVTKWTSLVAVDVTPTAPVGVVPENRMIPTLLPKGWSWRGLFGGARSSESMAPGSPQLNAPPPTTPLPLRTASAQPDRFQAVGRLPQGGTPAPLLVWLGSLLFGGGAILWRYGRPV